MLPGARDLRRPAGNALPRPAAPVRIMAPPPGTVAPTRLTPIRLPSTLLPLHPRALHPSRTAPAPVRSTGALVYFWPGQAPPYRCQTGDPRYSFLGCFAATTGERTIGHAVLVRAH